MGWSCVGQAAHKELARLRRQVKQLQTERDILTKATAWLPAEAVCDTRRIGTLLCRAHGGRYRSTLWMDRERATWSKGSSGVLDQIKEIEQALPFQLRGLDCDNGSEFLNHRLLRLLIH